ncbi:hypothetical protein HUX88_02260 [Duganella sp. BJB1802]|uniref:hypothetical protein n=1 Tax=Duganella sp. BJB1802 TaxID=2744575 RepID=UPI0015944A44|nr:hypothetical protein [Duganella sp. BJB1802]NVD69384.1 hypothetical protein [Duganella sp. BJB1802]
MKSFPSLLLCCMLAASINLPQAAHAAPAGAVAEARFAGPASPEQLAAASRLLQALEMPRLIRVLLGRAPKVDQETYEVNQHISQHASDAEICATLAPIYAKYLSADEADRLAIHYRTSVGRRQVTAMLAREGVVNGERNPYFTESEAREVRAIEALPVYKVFAAAQPQIFEANRAALHAWRGRYYAGYQKQVMANLAEIRTANANYKPGDPGGKFILRRTGLATLDKYAGIIADYNIETINTSRAMSNDLNRYGVDHLLMKERLVTAEGIGRARDILAKCEERMERYLHDRDLQQAAFRERVAASLPDKHAMAAFEPNLVREYDQLVRLGENQRALVDVYKRVLDFASSRLGAIQIQDNRLMFNDEADLQVFNALVAQVTKLSEEESALRGDGGQRKEAEGAGK